MCLLVVLGACNNERDSDDSRVFRYNESAGITSLDPAFARNLENMWAVNQLFDGLVELDENLRVVPLIAESWEISDSGRVYTFLLRDDVFFHRDSTSAAAARRVTAQDFVFSFNRILDPELASPGQWIFAPVDRSGAGGFEALDDRTLRIRLKRSFPPFLGMLATPYCNVVSPEAVARYGADFRSHPIGSGPFQFAFWLEDVALVFHRNPEFWQRDSAGARLPYLDAVHIDFVRDMSIEYLGLLKGDYDFMSGLHPAYLHELLAADGSLNPAFSDRIRFQRTPFLKTDYIGFLVDDSLEISREHPLNKPSVRRALGLAIDRNRMVRFLRNNSVVAASNGFIPKGMGGHRENASAQAFNLEHAIALLAEAGFPDGRGIPPIDITTTADYVDLCEFIQYAWRDLGLAVNVDVQPGGTHRENVAQSRAMVFRKSWLADYADAENFMALFHSRNFAPDGPNYTHFDRSQFDAWYDRALNTTNDAERFALYARMDSLVMAESPVIPLFYDQVSHFVSNDVLHFETNGVNMLNLKTAKKTSPQSDAK